MLEISLRAWQWVTQSLKLYLDSEVHFVGVVVGRAHPLEKTVKTLATHVNSTFAQKTGKTKKDTDLPGKNGKHGKNIVFFMIIISENRKSNNILGTNPVNFSKRWKTSTIKVFCIFIG